MYTVGDPDWFLFEAIFMCIAAMVLTWTKGRPKATITAAAVICAAAYWYNVWWWPLLFAAAYFTIRWAKRGSEFMDQTTIVEKVLAVITLVGGTIMILMSPAHAACYCECVGGRVEPICTSASDFPPLCPPRICPIINPSIQPINPIVMPPVGTSRCMQEQVWNPRTMRYEWETICR